MKKPAHGPSLYYATDKNIYSALNQHKIDMPTVLKLFEYRNTVASKKTPREDLAQYFARLPHDYNDHKTIAGKLGVVPRRERITSMDLAEADSAKLGLAIDELKKELEKTGDVVHVAKSGENITVSIRYTTIDYNKSEFTQVQKLDGVIELVKSGHGYVVRSTQNEYINKAREGVLNKLDKLSDTPVARVAISLFDIPRNTLRSKFFDELMKTLPGFSRQDVTDVYVYKPKPETDSTDDSEVTDEEGDSHVERVLLRGSGISRSPLLDDLRSSYHIVKVGWTAKELLGAGNVYDIEAVFSNPKDCVGFSFLLSGIYPLDEKGIVTKKRRPPLLSEIEKLSLAIEKRSRELVASLKLEFQQLKE